MAERNEAKSASRRKLEFKIFRRDALLRAFIFASPKENVVDPILWSSSFLNIFVNRLN